MSDVTFDYHQWSLRYPDLAQSISESLAELLFSEATLFLDPTDKSWVKNQAHRTLLLYMLTAHLAQLQQQASGGGGEMVGRINKGTEGSVSVSADTGQISATAEWFAQTPYGMTFWKATARYRSARYLSRFPNIRHCFWP